MINNTEEVDALQSDRLCISESNIELKLRKLNTGDIFNAARMVKRLEIKEELKSLIAEFSSDSDPISEQPEAKQVEKSKMEIGIDFIFSLMEILTNEKAENELCRFLAGPLGIEEQQVKELEIEHLAEALLRVADIDRWKYFLSQAAR